MIALVVEGIKQTASEASLPKGKALALEAVMEKTLEESFEVDVLVEALAEKAGSRAHS